MENYVKLYYNQLFGQIYWFPGVEKLKKIE